MRPLLKGRVMNFFERKPTAIDITIDEALAQLSGTKIDTEEYARMVDQIAKLTKIKEQTAPKSVSPDTLAIIAGNLVGILFVLHYEHAHVVVSKAFGSILKLK